MQYVFVLLRGEGLYVGGHLWRSDQFGNGNWQDVTSKLTGQLLLLATAVRHCWTQAKTQAIDKISLSICMPHLCYLISVHISSEYCCKNC